MPKREVRVSLSWKFAIIILCVGMLPLLALTTAATAWLFQDYRDTLLASYENTARYISKSIDGEFDSLNDISKVVYSYHPANAEQHPYVYMNFDNVRQILLTEDSEKRRQDMESFLSSVYYVDGSISGAYFVGTSPEQRFAFLAQTTFMQDWDRFIELAAPRGSDTQSRKLLMTPPHATDYFNGRRDAAFTVGRNYFDISSDYLSDQPYMGTLLLDVDTSIFADLFGPKDFGEGSEVFVYDRSGMCYYSTREEWMGRSLMEEGSGLNESDGQLNIRIPENKYGFLVTVKLDEDTLYAPIRETRNLIYGAIIVGTLLLIVISAFFARRLTRPVKDMMREMAKLEQGDFHVELPTGRRDELGVLSARFVDMSRQLESHIQQSYVAKLKQSEAEMTALKSQIYPHFLYNTLEVIRMTALEDQDGRKVSRMIEALAEQIHYMIGTLQDFVDLEKEAAIVEKYVYLLNCRISGEVRLVWELNGMRKTRVPKLILQPIVENAYVHGIKPAGEYGQVKISAALEESDLVISVMDNGVGMNEEKVRELYALLDSDAVGIKREDNWQSIGLKNVHDRVRYLFGEGYGIQITSCPGVGTFIRIRMPYQEEELSC